MPSYIAVLPLKDAEQRQRLKAVAHAARLPVSKFLRALIMAYIELQKPPEERAKSASIGQRTIDLNAFGEQLKIAVENEREQDF